jgi:Flp pilus assembly secretin CpaC
MSSCRLTAWLAVSLLCILGPLTVVVAKPPEKEKGSEPARPTLVTKTYNVADLIIPIDGDNGSGSVNLMKSSNQGGVGEKIQESRPLPTPTPQPAVSTSPRQVKTQEDQLIKLLTSSVQPQSWDELGGPGHVEYFPLGMALVVTQSPDVQEQIEELLTALRRLQEQEVSVEVRFVSVSDALLERLDMDFAPKGKNEEKPERIGVDFNYYGKVELKTNKCEAPTPKPANEPAEKPPCADTIKTRFLSDKEVFQFMEAVQGDLHSNVMQAPKITVFNGRSAGLCVTDQQFFVTGVNCIQANGQMAFVPRNEPFTLGLQMSVHPVISADRRYVSLNVNVKRTSLGSPTVALFPVTSQMPAGDTPGGKGKPVPFTQFVQQPVINTVALNLAFAIPDGGTVLVSGWRQTVETRNEFGPPVLSKVPYVNRLFKNVGYGRETENVMLLVTPRIIVNEAEEQRTVAACPCPAKPADKARPATETTTLARAVEEQVEKFEAARTAYRKAEQYRRAGRTELASRKYEEVRQLCPDTHQAELATQRLREMDEPRGTTEESEPPLSIAELVKEYHEACAAGRLEEARKLAAAALARDPACFSKDR